jgi:hypothetical protein
MSNSAYKPPAFEPGPGFNPNDSGISWNEATKFEYKPNEYKPKATSWFERTKENLFDITKNNLKDRGNNSRSGEDSAEFGRGTEGSAGKVLDNLGVVFPQQHAPMFIPGVQGEQGLFGKIAGVAAPFASLIPGAGPMIGAGLSAASRF